VAHGESRRCSDGEWRRVVARGDWRGGGWRRLWGLGSAMWGGARGSGNQGLAWWCSDGEGGDVWGSEGWWVATQGDRRGGITLGWCGDWLVVALGKRNMKSVG
jgi:hypothetical protein